MNQEFSLLPSHTKENKRSSFIRQLNEAYKMKQDFEIHTLEQVKKKILSEHKWLKTIE